MSISSLLGRLPLFSTLNEAELAILKEHLYTKRLVPGEELFAEGEKVIRSYVLISGTMDVYCRLADGSEKHLGVLRPGAMLGNMALIDHKPSNATHRAGKQPAFLVVLDQAVFERLFNAESTFAFKILDRITADLTGKLRNATLKLAEISEDDIARRSKSAKQGAQRVAQDLVASRLTELGLTETELDEMECVIPDALAHR